MRDSFKVRDIFFYNVMWFGLFVGYSLYFLVRSVDGNLINILPFILFIICSMKVNSKHIGDLRINSIYVNFAKDVDVVPQPICLNLDHYLNGF